MSLRPWPEIMGDFIVTLTWLESMGACKRDRRWFGAQYNGKVSARQLFADVAGLHDWQQWLDNVAWRHWLDQGPLPAGLTTTGTLDLRGYAHPLPAGLTTTGNLYLRGYAHPLPAGLTTTGYLYLEGYAHPLPAGLTTTGYLYLEGYAHPLPASLQGRAGA